MIFIANFKMMLTTPDAINFVQKNLHTYATLANQHKIILCPSATALFNLSKILQGSSVAIGGQTCGSNLSGAFTGDISATDLAACGATYCLAGHSERRSLYNEHNDAVATKAKLIIEAGLTPITCIGETLDELESSSTLKILEQQLTPILQAVATTKKKEFFIAYEPRWAIGSGRTPTASQLSEIFSFLKKTIQELSPNISFKLLYGGSVSSKTISTLASISPLDGFLIGGASLDFQEFQKIVDYFN